jgi:hypothetical protein
MEKAGDRERLLRLRRHWPRHRASEPCYELPPSHPSSPEAAMWGSLSRSGPHGNGLHLAKGQLPSTVFAARAAAFGPSRHIALR